MIIVNPQDGIHTLIVNGRDASYMSDIFCVITEKGTKEEQTEQTTILPNEFYSELDLSTTTFTEGGIYLITMYEGTEANFENLFYQGVILATSQEDYSLQDGQYQTPLSGDDNFKWAN
jgi:hypothetical protein